ncbi:MAG: xylulokinase [Tractidigestivibacter sp.]|jgi:sugar (pentulose or hexulose) kinase|uniref:xylulokinase n=1 Tax=Tractidigestivibacter sp. TaxID=2847320 RepID=UPI003D92BB67
MENTNASAARAIEAGDVTLGIEYGSTRIKAVLIGASHEVLAVGTHDWENSLADGYWTYPKSELDEGIAATYASLKNDCRERYGVVPHRLGALGVSAMMHGYLPFDEAGNLLVAFRTWRNTTTTRAARELSREFSFHIPERWSVSHVYQAILDGEPHVSRIAHLTTLAGYAHWRLTGEWALSVGDASGMFPIDSRTHNYDKAMLERFDALASEKGVFWKLEDLLPRVLLAGECAGHLSEEGARFLDPTGELEPGCPVCPPEGDAGTGMIATNSVAPRTGNVSAGTSVFSMVVLEHPLKDATRPEIDLVTTPSGDPVAMVHCNNCTSDLNEWVSLLVEYGKLMGASNDDVYQRLFELALQGDADCGGVVSVPFVSGETVVGVGTGRPLVMRKPGAHLGLANFMRASIMSCFAALALGNEALREEGVAIERLYAHGGIFKTPVVAQRLLAAALEAPVTVMETAGEGGAWGQAVAAAYMLRRKEGQSLSDYLSSEVFGSLSSTTLEPVPADVEGFRSYLGSFRRALVAEKAADNQDANN